MASDTGEIVLERPSNTMNLNEDEQALLDEIDITTPSRVINIGGGRPKQKRPRQRVVPRAPPSRREEYQEDPDIDAFMNPTKQSAPPPPPPAQEYDYGEVDDDDNDGGAEEYGAGEEEYHQHQHQHQQSGDYPSKGFTSIDEEKADILNKLARLEKKGFNVNKRLNAYSSISELRTEVKRIMYSIEVDQSIKFSRRMLVACVTGVEFLNKRYNPFEVMLEGWSETVMENVDDYDGVFEELYCKYKTKMNVAPEVKLIMMLGGSAMMFHLTNSMFKSALPNMNDVMKQNPDLLKNMVSAVQNTQATPPGTDPTNRPTTVSSAAPASGGGRREMQGPGMDISSLMGGIMMPPAPPINTKPISQQVIPEEVDFDDTESISDIVSISGESTGGEVRDVTLGGDGSKRKRKYNPRKKKTEVTL